MSMPELNRTIAIVGLGYVGLPLANAFIEKGFQVIGIDVDPDKVNLLSSGIGYLPDFPQEAHLAALSQGRFVPTTDYSQLRHAECAVICVPTPITGQGEPDLSCLIEAGQEISKHLQSGQLIILESSTYPGTTREVLKPLLEQSHLQAGEQFYLGYSPERIDPGNKQFALNKVPKLISGISPECIRRTKELYALIFDNLVLVSSPETAEIAKLLENSYRLINISFINEIAMICDRMKLDVWEVIDAAGTKPYGYAAFYPGPGAGGHCIPVDPLYLAWRAKQFDSNSMMIDAAIQINQRISPYIAEQLNHIIAQRSQGKSLADARILIYGIAYKKNTNDARESGALALFRLLRELGADVCYHDPNIPIIRIGSEPVQSIALTPSSVSQFDCVVIACDHSALPLQLLGDFAPLIYDTRNVTQGLKGKAAIYRLGEGVS